MRLLKSMAVSALAIAAVAVQASAADIYSSSANNGGYGTPSKINWTSIYIGGQVGYGNSNHRLGGDSFDYAEEETPSSVFNAYIDGLNSNGAFGGGTIGADYQAGRFVFGVFGDYNISNADFNAGASIFDREIFNAQISDDNGWVLAGRLGMALGSEQRTLVYGLVGYGQQDVSYDLTFGGEAESEDLTFSGAVAGGGIEYALSDFATIGVEYQHFFGGEETLYDDRDADGVGTLVTDDLDTDKVMAKLKLKLNDKLGF